jgi:uncharacterized membrane protein YedE/YeeE
MGFAIGRGDICAVAAVNYWINHKQASYLRAFIVATASAGLILLPSAWIFPDIVSLSYTYQLSWMTFIAGALFGLGAFLNSACVFGTIAHLSKGEMNYIGTIAGMFIGALLAPIVTSRADGYYFVELSKPTAIALFVWLIFIVIAFHELAIKHYLIKSDDFSNTLNRVWNPTLSMSIIGITGGLLYALIGNWGYLTVLSHGAAKLVTPYIPDVTLQVFTATGALIFGAIVAAWKTHRLKIRKPCFLLFFRKLAGGLLMSFSAIAIPGGNDALLLYGIPSLAPHAFIAYFIMLSVLVVLLKIYYEPEV